MKLTNKDVGKIVRFKPDSLPFEMLGVVDKVHSGINDKYHITARYTGVSFLVSTHTQIINKLDEYPDVQLTLDKAKAQEEIAEVINSNNNDDTEG